MKNEKNTLPLGKELSQLQSLAQMRMQAVDQLGDYIPQTIPQHVVTVLEGIQNKVSPRTKVTYVKGCNVIGNDLNEIE